MEVKFATPSPSLDALLRRHWKSITDDSSPETLTSQQVFDSGAYIVEASNPHTVGLYTFYPLGPLVYDAHATTDMTGVQATESARRACDLMFMHTDCEMLVCSCPDHNPRVKAFAFSIGFTKEIHRRNVYQKNGTAYGTVLASIPMTRWLINRCDGNLLVAGSICEQIEDQHKAERLFSAVKSMLKSMQPSTLKDS